MKYHPCFIGTLTWVRAESRTVSGGQFDWGGYLPKCNGGAQRFPQRGWKSRDECKGTRELNCEDDNPIRYESRA